MDFAETPCRVQPSNTYVKIFPRNFQNAHRVYKFLEKSAFLYFFQKVLDYTVAVSFMIGTRSGDKAKKE